MLYERITPNDIQIYQNLIDDNEWIEKGNESFLLLEDIKQILINIRESNIHPSVNVDKFSRITGVVQIGKNSTIMSGANICGPVVIGENCRIGPNCYVRKYSIIGNNVNIGQGAEVYMSIFLDGAQLRHFSFVGRSIIGKSTILGAGVITAVLRLDKQVLNIENIPSPIKRLGALIGNHCTLGVGAKVMPGKVIGNNTLIWPNILVNLNIPSNSIVKLNQSYDIRKRR